MGPVVISLVVVRIRPQGLIKLLDGTTPRLARSSRHRMGHYEGLVPGKSRCRKEARRSVRCTPRRSTSATYSTCLVHPPRFPGLRITPAGAWPSAISLDQPLTRDAAHHHFTRTLAGSQWAKLKGFQCCGIPLPRSVRGGVQEPVVDAWLGHQTGRDAAALPPSLPRTSYSRHGQVVQYWSQLG